MRATRNPPPRHGASDPAHEDDEDDEDQLPPLIGVTRASFSRTTSPAPLRLGESSLPRHPLSLGEVAPPRQGVILLGHPERQTLSTNHELATSSASPASPPLPRTTSAPHPGRPMGQILCATSSVAPVRLGSLHPPPFHAQSSPACSLPSSSPGGGKVPSPPPHGAVTSAALPAPPFAPAPLVGASHFVSSHTSQCHAMPISHTK